MNDDHLQEADVSRSEHQVRLTAINEEHKTSAEDLHFALTGWRQDEDRRRTQGAGFDHHLVKPVKPMSYRHYSEIRLSLPSNLEVTAVND
jgi:hypothetical protein